MRSKNPRYDPSRSGKNKRAIPAASVDERVPTLRPDPFEVAEIEGAGLIELDQLHPAMLPLPRMASGVIVADEGTAIDLDEAPYVRRGRHEPTEVTRGQVQALTAAGISQQHISELMGITVGTLVKHYAREMKVSKSAVIAQVHQRLLQIILTEKGKHVVSAIAFYLKSQAGWQETQRVELTGADGGPIVGANASEAKVQDAIFKLLERGRERAQLNVSEVIDVEDMTENEGDPSVPSD